MTTPERRTCKNCQRPINEKECPNLRCWASNAKGFCCWGCEQAYTQMPFEEAS